MMRLTKECPWEKWEQERDHILCGDLIGLLDSSILGQMLTHAFVDSMFAFAFGAVPPQTQLCPLQPYLSLGAGPECQAASPLWRLC